MTTYLYCYVLHSLTFASHPGYLASSSFGLCLCKPIVARFLQVCHDYAVASTWCSSSPMWLAFFCKHMLLLKPFVAKLLQVIPGHPYASSCSFGKPMVARYLHLNLKHSHASTCFASPLWLVWCRSLLAICMQALVASNLCRPSMVMFIQVCHGHQTWVQPSCSFERFYIHFDVYVWIKINQYPKGQWYFN